jgi:hypothetical protein
MSLAEQLTVDEHRAADGHRAAHEHRVADGHRVVDEQAARRALKAQVARLERELSGVVARGFPHIAPVHPTAQPRPSLSLGGPCLLTLGELERQRDDLALCVRSAHIQASERAQLEQRARALLEEFKREPQRHKFARLAVADLGEGSCGVWHVRPRLGLIGMLAGWWQVKLSSGCP